MSGGAAAAGAGGEVAGATIGAVGDVWSSYNAIYAAQVDADATRYAADMDKYVAGQDNLRQQNEFRHDYEMLGERRKDLNDANTRDIISSNVRLQYDKRAREVSQAREMRGLRRALSEFKLPSFLGGGTASPPTGGGTGRPAGGGGTRLAATAGGGVGLLLPLLGVAALGAGAWYFWG